MSKYIWGDEETKHFLELHPDDILKAVDELGLRSTGRILQLNSLENRVFQVEVELTEEEKSPSDHYRILKFYRPGRWSEGQLRDEHEFLHELVENEIPVIAPLKINGETLFKKNNMFYTVFPKRGGRIPDEMTDETVEWLGRLMARLHVVGKKHPAKHRLSLTPQSFGEQNLKLLLENKLISPHLESSYQKTVEELLKVITPMFKDVVNQRIHGDSHRGNILYGSEGLFMVDFDDMMMGPPVQDLWLAFPGRDQETKIQRELFLEAYETLNDFNYGTLKLIEPLRSLRFIHFSAWIGKRFEDESFKRNFSHYGTPEYWQGQIADIRDQLEFILDQQ